KGIKYGFTQTLGEEIGMVFWNESYFFRQIKIKIENFPSTSSAYGVIYEAIGNSVPERMSSIYFRKT
ncbi:MAG: hypothetical protein ACYSR0_05695, partial [Planctomycetota bacterium]